MGFSREQLEAARGRHVPDLVGPDVRLLFVGINPGLWSAAAAAHFAHPGNRFYKALHSAGIASGGSAKQPQALDVHQGFDNAIVSVLLDRRIGITNLVDRPTARAEELAPDELREGALRLAEKVAAWRPRVVALVGITAHRAAFARRGADVGRQGDDIAGAELWVLPNPSGLNAHYQLPDLARLYREAAEAAGLMLGPLRM
ncbi:MAG: mismatch-specific DNA-glycosylase [Actinomycetota bacterium]|nr:mismatch-specific DNA-glycosylase [Actinomycetota bacterium]